MRAEELKQLIEKGIPGSEVIVKGEGDHFDAIVVSESFKDQSMVKQHQAVYALLGDGFQSEIHALALHTFTPAQWTKQRHFQ